MKTSFSIVAPIFNEAEALPSVLEYWVQTITNFGAEHVELILVNDGSRDSSAVIIDRFSQLHSFIKTIHLPSNQGYGAAMQAGIRSSRNDWVVSIDSDGQFDLKEALSLADVSSKSGKSLLAYRAKKHDVATKRFADLCYRNLFNILMRTNIADPNCAVRIAPRALLQTLKIRSKGYLFPSEMAWLLTRSSKQILEAPVTHRQRVAGTSKLSLLTQPFVMTLAILRLKLRWR